MSRHQTLIALMACGAIAAGCGDDDTGATSKREAKPVDIAARSVQLEKNPYDLRCADIRDKVASARMTRVVQYALADDARIRGLNRLQASQSIGVRSGEFRADL